MCFGLSIVTEMTLTLIRECMKEISDEVLADANDHQQLAHLLSLQLANTNLRFSAFGCFDVDMNVMKIICFGTFSYLTVLLQFNPA
uniref:Gustatory receptor 31 n=1 Tax=Propsilocerus akamusi TaxID=903466 RepID=A0A7D0PAV8_9DIPT|nr:gustatory receptor 31 [Propsilocerus akamusi]